MKKQLLLVVAAATLTASAWAQGTDYTNPIITAMPSLTIAPDAAAAGMGDVGTATRPDMNSQHWNPAKYAFFEERGGISASYTPWLRSLVGDIDLAYLSGFYRFDELQAISAGFTYFSMGKVDLIDNTGNMFQEAHPNEWALDVAYSRKLHEYVSMSATLRFLYSDLNNGANASVANGGTELNPAWSAVVLARIRKDGILLRINHHPQLHRRPQDTSLGESLRRLRLVRDLSDHLRRGV